MEKEIIIVAKDFSEYPGPRYIKQGEFSGEEFYVNKLNPVFADCVTNNKILELNLDSTAGFATSFLDEALGELVYDFSEKVVLDNLIIWSEEEPEWKEYMEKETYPQWESRRLKGETPKCSEKHLIYYLDTLDNKVKQKER